MVIQSMKSSELTMLTIERGASSPGGPGKHPQRLGHGKVPGPRKRRWGSRDA